MSQPKHKVATIIGEGPPEEILEDLSSYLIIEQAAALASLKKAAVEKTLNQVTDTAQISGEEMAAQARLLAEMYPPMTLGHLTLGQDHVTCPIFTPDQSTITHAGDEVASINQLPNETNAMTNAQQATVTNNDINTADASTIVGLDFVGSSADDGARTLPALPLEPSVAGTTVVGDASAAGTFIVGSGAPAVITGASKKWPPQPLVSLDHTAGAEDQASYVNIWEQPSAPGLTVGSRDPELREVFSKSEVAITPIISDEALNAELQSPNLQAIKPFDPTATHNKKKSSYAEKKRARAAQASPEKLQALVDASKRGEVGHQPLPARRPAALLSAPANVAQQRMQAILAQQVQQQRPCINIDAESDDPLGRLLDMYTSGDHVITVDSSGATFGSFNTLAGFYLFLQLKDKTDMAMVEQLRRADARQARTILKQSHLFQRELGHYEMVAWALWDYMNRPEHTEAAARLASWHYDFSCRFLFGQHVEHGKVVRVGQWVAANQADWWLAAVVAIQKALLATLTTGEQAYPDFREVVDIENTRMQRLANPRKGRPAA